MTKVYYVPNYDQKDENRIFTALNVFIKYNKYYLKKYINYNYYI
jgi:hypothetical protein